MVRYLPFLISLVLTVYALFSCIQTRNEDVPYLPKLVWLVLIVFVPFAGPITWLLMSRQAARTAGRKRPAGPGRPPGTPGSRPSRPRPVAPDDDPDFLASLDRYRDPRMGGRTPDGSPDESPEQTPGQDRTQDQAPNRAPDEPGEDQPAPERPDDPDGSGGSGRQTPTERDDGKS